MPVSAAELKSHTAIWRNIEKEIEDYFASSPGLSLSNPLELELPDSPEASLPEMTSFFDKFDPSDYYGADKNVYVFHANQFGTFIDTAAKLFDRVIDDKRQYDSLNLQRFQARIDIAEFLKITKLAESELYDPNHGKYEKEAAKIDSDSVDESKRLLNAARDAAWAAFHARGAAVPAGKTQLDWVDINELAMKGNVADANLHSEQVRKDLLLRKVDHEEALYTSAEHRHTLKNMVGFLKIKELLSVGGALNFNEQISAIAERSSIDMREAWMLCVAISIGVEGILGEARPFNITLPDARAIEKSILWLRETLNLANRTLLSYQPVIFRVSIKRESGISDLAGMLKSGGIISFDLTPNGISLNASRVLLTGVSASASGLSPQDHLSFEVTCPTQTLLSKDGSRKIGILPEITTRFGRVRSSDFPVPEDRISSNTMVNRTVFGIWKVRAINPPDSIAAINDLYLDLHTIIKM